MRLVFVTLPASDAEAMLLLLLRERLVALAKSGGKENG